MTTAKAKKQHLIALNQEQLEFLYSDLMNLITDPKASESYSYEEVLILASIAKKLKKRLGPSHV